MKKISIIACAILAASLLFSCKNETAGTIDYNSVRTTKTVNNYFVSGTITEVEEYEEAYYTYDANGKNETQSTGEKQKTTTTTKIKSVPSVVSFNTDSKLETNYQYYMVEFDSEEDAGWQSVKYDVDQIYNSSTKKYEDNPLKPTDKAMGNGDPDTFIHGKTFNFYAVDGTLYYSVNGQSIEVEADEAELSSGEDFTLKLTFTDSVSGYDDKDFSGDNKATSRDTQSGKTTYTYDLTFTAK